MDKKQAEYFGKFYLSLYSSLQSRKRLSKFKELRPLLDEAWPKCLKRLHLDMLHAGEQIKDEELKKRVEAFPLTFSFRVHPKTGLVTILTGDRYLERALYYGTHTLPAIKPLHLFVRYLHESVLLSNIVFTARDFTNETKL